MAASAPSAATRERVSRFTLLQASAVVVFGAAAAATLYFVRTMSDSMPMPGGWNMSMAWTPLGSWLYASLMFSLMWVAMMIFMMLPSTWPVLMLVRRLQHFQAARHPDLLTWTVAAGYFLAWTAFGIGALLAGTGIGRAAMSSEAFSRAVPLLTGAVVIVAGIYQWMPVKSACLRHCRDPLLVVAHVRPGWLGALRLGLHHGNYCVACCWALMAIQLALGIMSLPLMIAIALVIAWEKLATSSTLPARVSGAAAAAAGVWIATSAVLHW
jgi:predicted metal-binding membrane protein